MRIDKHNFFFQYTGLIFALLLINGLVFLYYQNTINKIVGTYVYPLDDTYIHLAIAKNAALHNNWGVTQYEFSSTSSSPFYTFVIAVLMKIFGDNDIYPLFVNIFFGNLIILALNAFIKNKIWFIVCILFLCTPVLLHIQILSGMEHTAHIFMILAAFMLFSKLIDSEFSNKKYRIFFLLVTSLLCLTRYESMFFIVPVLLILLLNKQYSLLLSVFISGFLPVLLFGLWSISNGAFFFPNTLLVKGDIAVNRGILRIILHYAAKLYRNIYSPIMIGPVVIILLIIIQRFIVEKTNSFNGVIDLLKKHSLVFITLATISLHVCFAGIGWLYRYEAYLLSLLYLTLVILFYRNVSVVKDGMTVMAIAILIIFPAIAQRIRESNNVMELAGKNIHDQQIQMSKFLGTYYNESMVMANDIGAITYYTNIKLKDLVGLGSSDILVERKKLGGGGGILATALSKYKQYSLVIIYDSWFEIETETDYENLGLIKIAELWIEDNVICGGNPVSFYTSDEMMVEEMRANMIRFKENVPADVTIKVF
ncbi:MAG: hypothetical protein LBQ93_04485 [Treponema sp.]|jgi:hypothetical protein|nr:hypothetical protein [Treponema sp.]